MHGPVNVNQIIFHHLINSWFSRHINSNVANKAIQSVIRSLIIISTKMGQKYTGCYQSPRAEQRTFKPHKFTTTELYWGKFLWVSRYTIMHEFKFFESRKLT